jgi:hypothetical protein
VFILLILGLDDKEKLSRQRQMLNKKLGLDMAGSLKLGLDGDLFSDEDLKSGLNGSNGNSSMQEKVLSTSLLSKF